MVKLIRELQISDPIKIDNFLLECSTKLATLKMKDDKSINSILTNAKTKMSLKLLRLRGKSITNKNEIDSYRLNKNESICRISAKFLEDMQKDLRKGEGYRFRNISIHKIMNGQKGEYMELNYKNDILFIKVFQ